ARLSARTTDDPNRPSRRQCASLPHGLGLSCRGGPEQCWKGYANRCGDPRWVVGSHPSHDIPGDWVPWSLTRSRNVLAPEMLRPGRAFLCNCPRGPGKEHTYNLVT